MQIPIFNRDPVQSAIECPDNWTIKLPIEGAQVLACSYTDEQLALAPKTKKDTIRVRRQTTHPITKWAISSLTNWQWVLDFSLAGCQEKAWRYRSGLPFHHTFLVWCQNNPPKLPKFSSTSHYKMAGFENLPLTVSYQTYFNANKQHLAVWRRRGAPRWFIKQPL